MKCEVIARVRVYMRFRVDPEPNCLKQHSKSLKVHVSMVETYKNLYIW